MLYLEVSYFVSKFVYQVMCSFIVSSLGMGLWASFLIRKLHPSMLSTKCSLIIIWSLFKEDSIISWFKNISWSHYSKSFWLVCVLLLRDRHEFLTWFKFKALFYISTNRSTSCFSIGFSKRIFRFNTWNISTITYIYDYYN